MWAKCQTALAVSFITPARKSLKIINEYSSVHSRVLSAQPSLPVHFEIGVFVWWSPVLQELTMNQIAVQTVSTKQKTKQKIKAKLFIVWHPRLSRDVWECNSLENARLIEALGSADTKRFTARFYMLARTINNASPLKRSFVIKGLSSSTISRVQSGHFFGIITIGCDKQPFTELNMSVFL